MRASVSASRVALWAIFVLVSAEDIFVDPNGYLIYCPCMGRFGNQADHFLGSLAFAKKVGRSLVLPPWRTYKNVPFNDFFQVSTIRQYHNVITAEEFMETVAPRIWPVGSRIGFCWLPQNSDAKCTMKEGNPFGPFWDGLGVEFDDYVVYRLSYEDDDIPLWVDRYPASKYPVLAFRGAPAAFPVRKDYSSLHRLLKWSEEIDMDARAIVLKHFGSSKFVGIHLRNGADWERACEHGVGLPKFMASPQCLSADASGSGVDVAVSMAMCLPSTDEVLRRTKEAVVRTGARHVYVATDRHAMVGELQAALATYSVESVFHLDPYLPQIDLAILAKSEHFVGNCVSSFSAFVKRERDVYNRSSDFFGLLRD